MKLHDHQSFEQKKTKSFRFAILNNHILGLLIPTLLVFSDNAIDLSFVPLTFMAILQMEGREQKIREFKPEITVTSREGRRKQKPGNYQLRRVLPLDLKPDMVSKRRKRQNSLRVN